MVRKLNLMNKQIGMVKEVCKPCDNCDHECHCSNGGSCCGGQCQCGNCECKKEEE